MEKLNISNQAFWDVDFNKVDIVEKADFVISRVFEYGTLSDLRNLFSYYGINEIKKTVKQVPFLRQNAISKASFLLDIPKVDFKCYNTRPSHLPF